MYVQNDHKSGLVPASFPMRTSYINPPSLSISSRGNESGCRTHVLGIGKMRWQNKLAIDADVVQWVAEDQSS